MKVATGRVIEGRIVVEAEDLSEGSVVTIIAQDGDADFDITPEEEQELHAAIEEAERGEIIPWRELREQLRRKR